jgi:hypothetical protein
MAVQSYNPNFGRNGHAASMRKFMEAHVADTASLLNLAEGKEVDATRPPYDPSHPDNQWPIMLHHPEKGELTVGASLVGVQDTPGQPSKRAAIQKGNEKLVADAIARGYRKEPYAKPQIAVLDPAAEKLELKRKLDEQQGQITMLLDRINKGEAAKPAPAA